MVHEQIDEIYPYIGSHDEVNRDKRVLAQIAEFVKKEGEARPPEDSHRRYLNLRKAIRARITRAVNRIQNAIQAIPAKEATEDVATTVNAEVINLQRDIVDEAALSILARKDFPNVQMFEEDKLRRSERIALAVKVVYAAEKWIEQIPVPEGEEPFMMSHAYHPGMDFVPREELPEPPGEGAAFLPSAESTLATGRGLLAEPILQRGVREKIQSTRAPPRLPIFGLHEPLEEDPAKKASTPAPTPRKRTQAPTAFGEESTMDEKFTQLIEKQNEILNKNLYQGVNEDLPKFSGDYRSWNQWHQQFTSLVDKNPKLSTIVKYRKLLRALEGEALRAVSHFEFEASIYPLVKKCLMERFGREHLVMTDMIRQVQKHEQVSETNVEKFRKYIDLCYQMVFLMKKLEPESYKQASYPTLLIEEKLPMSCLREWEAQIQTLELMGVTIPPEDRVERQLNWLSKYVENIKLAQIKNPQLKSQGGQSFNKNGQKPATNSGKKNGNGQEKPKTLNNFLTMAEMKKTVTKGVKSEDPKKCCFDGGAHPPRLCRWRDLKKDPKGNKEKVLQAGLCLLCLKKGHVAKDCKSQATCTIDDCGQKHHKFLHAGVAITPHEE